MVGLGIATFAKVFDLLCNFAIPTPSITRDRDEQWEYEKLAIKNDMERERDEEEQANKEPAVEMIVGSDVVQEIINS